ncbi:uncharacterized protein SPSK_01041 [Sporothrix schenckii 1099-18]|uniref:MARVEL domain-containing protein n=2 Tax=Sporothrix schenckii TaxID=29908 RepID=U7PPY6_SPOS1|nr:uncharacterized protein SPSK_01041 [Sporothrix schenckii 1099-18]ERS96545.1 hypothetical protein HMPREF1624_06750 [Sporothrix schenckii ATCC 58251]KJR81215.1 hypothetical protein SPSK_01041 [Sporothrix schenckii 1099-18]
MARSSIGLRALEFFNRLVIFLCSIVVLGIFAYFLAKLRSANLYVPTWTRAVTGLAGAAALYSLICLLLLWCVGGHPVAFALALILDICFIASFVYIAVANRGGAGSCNGRNIRTPFGNGNADVNRINNQNGVSVNIPTFRVSCRLEKACLAVSIVAIAFLLFTLISGFLLFRSHRREKKFGPGPNNNYTSGSGRRKGLFGKKRKTENGRGDGYQDPNALPAHAEPNQMRESYATETTAVGHHGYGDNGVIDPNKTQEYTNRAYGNKGLETGAALGGAAAVGSGLANRTMRSGKNTEPASRGANYAEPTARNDNYVDPVATGRSGVDPNLQSSVDPSYLRDGSGGIAEAPANEVPSIRGTGVDNYDNIRTTAADHTNKAYNTARTTGTTGTTGTSNFAGSGDASALRGTQVGDYAADNYANVRGQTPQVSSLGGTGVGSAAVAGAATGAATGTVASRAAHPGSTVHNTGTDNYNARGTGTGTDNYTNVRGTGTNNYADTRSTGTDNYNARGTGTDNYTNTRGTGTDNYTNTRGTGTDNYTNARNAGTDNYNTRGTGTDNYADARGQAPNVSSAGGTGIGSNTVTGATTGAATGAATGSATSGAAHPSSTVYNTGTDNYKTGGTDNYNTRGTGIDNYNTRNTGTDNYNTRGTGTDNYNTHGTGTDNYTNARGTGTDNYTNARGQTPQVSSVGGTGVGSSAATGTSTGAATSGAADPSSTVRGTGVAGDSANARGTTVDPNVWGGAIDPATGNSAGLRGSVETGVRGLKDQVVGAARKYGNLSQF